MQGVSLDDKVTLYQAICLTVSKRKLEIARALATSPSLYCLMSRPAGVNPNETEELMETIRLIRDRYNLTILTEA